jgi:hypothetical protein
MKITVIRGSIKHNDKVYKIGETLELDEKGALAIVHSGIAEEYVQPVAPEVEEEKAPEAPKVPEQPESTGSLTVEPSLDWTRPELNQYALEHGVKEPEKAANKPKLLRLIEEAK